MNCQVLIPLKVKTPGGIREVKAGEIITLSKDMARGLIERGKVRPLATPSHEELKTLYLDAFNRTGWVLGLMAKPEVQKVEDMLNKTWVDCLEGKATIKDFKTTLSSWCSQICRMKPPSL